MNLTIRIRPIDPPRHALFQSADGMAHLSYYSDGVSFCWSGDPGQPIEASPGGAGEPACWEIDWPELTAVDVDGLFPPVAADPNRWRPLAACLVFQAVCDAALAHLDAL